MLSSFFACGRICDQGWETTLRLRSRFFVQTQPNLPHNFYLFAYCESVLFGFDNNALFESLGSCIFSQTHEHLTQAALPKSICL